MYSFLQKNQGKISLKTAIFSLALILIASTSGFSMLKFIKKATQEGNLTAGLPIVFAADEEAIFKIDLDQIDLEQSEIDISGPGQSQEKFEIAMVLLDNGQYELKVKPKKPTIKPGRYQVSARFVTPQGIKDYSQDFYWGVLALNTNKSVYLPNERVYIQMAVLTDEGDTICDADLTLKIKNEEVKVIKNPQCGPNNIIDEPDYYAYYQLGGPGTYQVELIAEIENGTRSIKDLIEVKESLPFEVERIGPTRIYPLADYQMKFNIKTNQDFHGQVIETVPEGFEILGKISWLVNWQAGQTYQLSYTFDAPDISPEFYLLGPLKIGDWQEARHWQIASDQTDTEYCITTDGETINLGTGGGSTPACNDLDTSSTGSDNGTVRTITEETTGGNRQTLDVDYVFNTTQSQGSISQLDITINAWTTAESFSVFIYNDTGSSDTDTGIDVIATADGTTYTKTLCSSGCDITGSPADYINSSGDIQLTYDDDDYISKEAVDTLTIDFHKINVTYEAQEPPTITSVTDSPDPVSAGATVTFSVDWDDINTNEQIKVKICKTEGLVDQNCVPENNYWATSTDYTDSDPADVIYTTTVDDFGLHNYYAYVCDNGNGGLCSGFAFGTFGVGGVIRVKGDVRVKGGVRIKRY